MDAKAGCADITGIDVGAGAAFVDQAGDLAGIPTIDHPQDSFDSTRQAILFTGHGRILGEIIA